MEKFVTSDFRLGIMAGGQLGKMLAIDASRWDVKTYVLDSGSHCPASTVCTSLIEGDCANFDDVYRFGQQVDMVTFEIENVNVDALRKLKAEGKPVFPDPDVLALIQDKGKQKLFYRDHQIPSPDFTLVENAEQIRQRLQEGKIEIPFVQKARTEGYDGRGVAAIRSREDLPKLLDCPSVIEQLVDIDRELAVIVARNGKGQMAAYPVVEMAFNPEANLVEMLLSPARIEEGLQQQATELALQVAEKSGIQGLLAVELFLDRSGKLWVNESAPRPHNSGHHTIESAVTSQYEQHLRAVLDLPLGNTELKCPAVMINLLGEPGHEGPARYEGLAESLDIPGVKVHIYGKRDTRPFRKMGHITVVAPTLEEARRRAAAVKEKVKVCSW
ncbi:MAG: 5-(carboxyamino)imidazole ribonucleotide synthase [Phycisphaerae bacterium]